MQDLKINNYTNDEGAPTGGDVSGLGIGIKWQNGPLGRGDDRIEANGAFLTTVIRAALTRLEYFQDSKFKCKENEWAIDNLRSAINHLNSRTQRRENQGTEGTHKGT